MNVQKQLARDMQWAAEVMLEGACFNGQWEIAKLWKQHLKWLKENENATIQDAAANMDELGLP